MPAPQTASCELGAPPRLAGPRGSDCLETLSLPPSGPPPHGAEADSYARGLAALADVVEDLAGRVQGVREHVLTAAASMIVARDLRDNGNTSAAAEILANTFPECPDQDRRIHLVAAEDRELVLRVRSLENILIAQSNEIAEAEKRTALRCEEGRLAASAAREAALNVQALAQELDRATQERKSAEQTLSDTHEKLAAAKERARAAAIRVDLLERAARDLAEPPSSRAVAKSEEESSRDADGRPVSTAPARKVLRRRRAQGRGRKGVKVAAEPRYWDETTDVSGRHTAGYKILVQDVPGHFDRANIDAWLAKCNCPEPVDINDNLPLTRLSRAQLVLTFAMPSDAIFAKSALHDKDLELNRHRTQTKWWKAGEPD